MGSDKGLEILEKEMNYELIKINSKEFKIGSLGVVRKLKITKLLGNLIIPLVKIFTKTGGGKTNIDDVAILMHELDIGKIEEILSIVLDTKDKDILDNVGDDEFVDILVAIIKHNDWSNIPKKAERVAEAINQI